MTHSDDHQGLLDQYLQLLRLLSEVRERFPSDDSPEVVLVSNQLARLETRIRAVSAPETD
jgi:hypothetical protein